MVKLVWQRKELLMDELEKIIKRLSVEAVEITPRLGPKGGGRAAWARKKKKPYPSPRITKKKTKEWERKTKEAGHTFTVPSPGAGRFTGRL